MKMLVVVSIDPPTADDLPKVLDHMYPPGIPYFDEKVRIAPDPITVQTVVDYLDDDMGPLAKPTIGQYADAGEINALDRIDREEVTINGVTTTYGDLDRHAHACLHSNESTGAEKGMATALMTLLDELDDARIRIAEMGD